MRGRLGALLRWRRRSCRNGTWSASKKVDTQSETGKTIENPRQQDDSLYVGPACVAVCQQRRNMHRTNQQVWVESDVAVLRQGVKCPTLPSVLALLSLSDLRMSLENRFRNDDLRVGLDDDVEADPAAPVNGDADRDGVPCVALAPAPTRPPATTIRSVRPEWNARLARRFNTSPARQPHTHIAHTHYTLQRV